MLKSIDVSNTIEFSSFLQFESILLKHMLFDKTNVLEWEKNWNEI